MEGRVESWILGVILHCTIFIVLARPEEVFNTTPPPLRTNFSCFGRVMGFYADIEANCKVYHTCDDHGNKFSYRCPEETAFRQDALICDHARLVDCCATTYDNKKSLRGSRSEEENLGLNVPSLFNVPPSLDNSNDHRSFSRSFQVIQPPDQSLTDKTQPGFVFSARVFLRNRQDHDLHKKPMNSQETEQSIGSILDKSRCNRNEEQKMTDSGLKNQVRFQFSSTPRPFSRDSKEDSSLSNRFSSFTRSDLDTKSLLGRTFVNVPMISTKTQPPRKNSFQTTTVFSSSTKLPTNDIPRPNSNTYNNRDYPYFETLRSIQANAKSTITTTSRTTIASTEIPVHALTMSLKPLVPNELEYDPYYPRIPTSTEAYYTDNHLNKGSAESFRYTTQPSWSGIHFEIPAVLPDLNTLEDLVDRRKLFYIPRVTRNSFSNV